jgi:hypothetical protein
VRIALVCLLATACSIPAQSLRTITIPPSGEKVIATDKSFLIYPFEDERGVEAGLFPFIDFVPGVDMIYSHVYARYPETSGLLRGNVDGRSVVTTGELPHAMPYMLGTLFRQMGFATAWAALDEVDPQRDLKTFDYVIRGRLKSTRLHLAGNFLPLAFLSVLGLPCVFVDYRIEYEVVLSKNGGGELMRKTYEWSGKKAVGIYYHWTAAYDLFVEGLSRTLPRVVGDLAGALPR